MQSDLSTDDVAQPDFGSMKMRPLDPAQLWVLRIRTILATMLLIPVGFPVFAIPLLENPQGRNLVAGALLLAALLLILLLPGRRYRAWSYGENEDELHVAHGLLVRSRTVIPVARIQHIDIAQGPIERRFGVATLIVHTAGTRGASIPLPGLAMAEAERMRDRIRNKIRQDRAWS